MNHFMARLIFCFFAEDTDIFSRPKLFASTVETMSASDSSNTHEVIGTIFRAMNVKIADRAAAGIPRWADLFPYVNGGLFSGSPDVPRFSRIARSYLLDIGSLDWKKINPDIVRRQNNRDVLRLLLTEASAHLGWQFRRSLADAASGGTRRFSA